MKHKKELVIILLCMIMAPCIGLGIIQSNRVHPPSTQRATPTPIKYEIIDLPPEYEVLWEISTESISHPQNKGSINLVAGSQNAYLINRFGDLVTMNLLTDEPYFSTRSLQNGFAGSARATTLAINADRLFIGFDGTQKISGNTEWGSGSIESFDLNDHSQTWVQSVAGSRTLDTVIATENTVSVDGDFSSSYFLFDTHSGALLEKLNKNNQHFIWARNQKISYERSRNASFLAIDRLTNIIIWESPFNYGVYQPPIFTDNTIVTRIGESNDSGKVMGLDIITGNILWEYESSISNVSVSNSTAFFINHEIQLVAIDVETGNVRETISFIPSTRTYSFEDTFHVATNERTILVYLGEGNQIIAIGY